MSSISAFSSVGLTKLETCYQAVWLYFFMKYQNRVSGAYPVGKILDLSIDDLAVAKEQVDRINELDQIFTRAGEEKKPPVKEVKTLKVILEFLKARKRRPSWTFNLDDGD